MSKQPTWTDLRRVAQSVRVVAESSLDREQAALHAVCDLAGAPFAQLYRGQIVSSDSLRLVSLHEHGVEDRQRELLLSYLAENGQDDPLIAPGVEFMRKESGSLVLPRQQLISDREFYRSDHYRNLRATLDFDQCVNLSIRATRDLTISIAIHRPRGERPFSEHELKLLEVFWAEVSLMIGWPGAPRGGWLRHWDGNLMDLSDLRGGQSRFEEIAERVKLSRREREVAIWMCRGASNKEIAQELSISSQTVKRHVSAVLRKTMSDSRTEAAYRLGGSS